MRPLKAQGGKYMVSVAKSEHHLYQTYTPTQSNDPHIELLEQRIAELIQKLNQFEGADWSKQGINTVYALKNELDFMISQRNRLHQRASELKAALYLTTATTRECASALEQSNAAGARTKTV